MVTKPKPLWVRWMETPRGREQAYKLYILLVILINVTIVVGLILFFLFLTIR